jgi:hypothetical protein
MPKLTNPKSNAAPRRSGRTVSGRYQVLGTTFDGVKILRPKGKPTHFTPRQIREAIESVRRSSSD